MSPYFNRLYQLCLIPLLVLAGLVRTAGALEIVIVRSSSIAPYQRAVSSFQAELGHSVALGGKTIQPFNYHEILLAGEADRHALRSEIFRFWPDLILAVGGKALSAALDFADIPVFYMLAPDAPSLVAGHRNVTGIDMEVAPERQLREVKRLLPRVKMVGMVYDPARAAQFVREAEEAALGLGLALSARPIHSAREVLPGLKALDPAVDLLWMLPDLYQTSSMGLEALFLFALENRIPVMTFAPRYLASGAMLAVGFDFEGMGGEAAALVAQFLSGTPLEQLPPVKTRRLQVTVNKIKNGLARLTINPGGEE